MDRISTNPQFLIIGVLFISYFSGYSADWVSNNLYPSKYDSSLYQVDKIKFSGNKFVDATFLKSIISSKELEKGILFKSVENLYNETKKNSYTPPVVEESLKESLDEFAKDIPYFSRYYTSNDSSSIYNYYNTKGFHLIKINKKFYPDSNLKKNILEFQIKENERFKVGQFLIIGIDSLQEIHKINIKNLRDIEEGDFFDEGLVFSSNSKIERYLHNKGYRFASSYLERVIIDRETKTDSLRLVVNPGIFLKIGKVNFVHYTFGNKKISNKLLYKIIDLDSGLVYNESYLENVQKRLYDLGEFNSVSIIPDKIDSTNKIMDVKILIEYGDQKETKIKAGINRTNDNFTNLFGEAYIQHKNIFGGAQLIKPFFSVIYRDINDLNNSRANTGRKYIVEWGNGGLPQPDEYQLGMSYLEHSLTKIGDARILLDLKPQFSLRRIFNDFNITRLSLPINFPVIFKTNLDFSSLTFKFLVESERTDNFNSIFNDNNASDDLTTQRLLEANITYQKLNDYSLENGTFPLTTLLFGISAQKDERNNAFYPSKGYLINLQLEANSPNIALSNYFRSIFDVMYFKKVNKNLVFASKLKGGYIWFYDPTNFYVPLDKQFYSGGANSVRGWAARKLRFSGSYDSSLVSTGQVSFLENYVGNTAMMEFSLELRYNLEKPRKMKGFLADFIEASSFTFYLDGGNSFNWLIDDKIQDSFSFGKFAYSIGTGYGYNTPLGPFRIDYALPIFGPMTDPQSLQDFQTFANPGFRMNDRNWFASGSFHLALGYAF